MKRVPRNLVLDAGALIAAEKGDKFVTVMADEAVRNALLVLLPTTVVAEVWHGKSGQAEVSRLIAGSKPCGLNIATAKKVGARRNPYPKASIADAHVVEIALANTPATILTDDPDLDALLDGVEESRVRIEQVKGSRKRA